MVSLMAWAIRGKYKVIRLRQSLTRAVPCGEPGAQRWDGQLLRLEANNKASNKREAVDVSKHHLSSDRFNRAHSAATLVEEFRSLLQPAVGLHSRVAARWQ